MAKDKKKIRKQRVKKPAKALRKAAPKMKMAHNLKKVLQKKAEARKAEADFDNETARRLKDVLQKKAEARNAEAEFDMKTMAQQFGKAFGNAANKSLASKDDP